MLFGFWRGKRLLDLEPRMQGGGKFELRTLELDESTPFERSWLTGQMMSMYFKYIDEHPTTDWQERADAILAAVKVLEDAPATAQFVESVRAIRDCTQPTGEHTVLALGERLTWVANALDDLDKATKKP